MPGQELKDLAAQVKDVSVTVGMGSRCHTDLSGIVEKVMAQYGAVVARSLEEAKAYSRSQVRSSRAGWGNAAGQNGLQQRWLRPPAALRAETLGEGNGETQGGRSPQQ